MLHRILSFERVECFPKLQIDVRLGDDIAYFLDFGIICIPSIELSNKFHTVKEAKLYVVVTISRSFSYHVYLWHRVIIVQMVRTVR